MKSYMMHRWSLIALVIAFGLAGCAGSNNSAAKTQQDADRVDLDTFIQQLSRVGILAVERGPAGQEILSTFGERLALNGTDIADAYFFRDTSQAELEASLADLMAKYDVYQKDNLVLVHLTKRDPAVVTGLTDLLGLPR